MKIISLLLFACLLLSPTLSISAAPPADSQIKNAAYDIDRYYKQFAGKTNVSASTAKRTLKLLTISRQNLDSSTHKSDPSWIDANNRHNALIKFLNSIANPASNATQVTTTQQKPTKAATSTVSKPSSGTNQMISQYRVRIKKITRDIESVLQTMDKGGVKPFQNAAYINKFQQSYDRFSASISKYSEFGNDPDVVIAKNKLQEFANMLAFGKKEAAKQVAGLGDVQSQLKKINAIMHSLKIPDSPQRPFAEGELIAWAKQLASIRNRALEAYKPLPQIKQQANLPNNPGTVEQGAPFDLNDISRMERGLSGIASEADSSLSSFLNNLVNATSGTEHQLDFYDNLDPADSHAQSNSFLGEGNAENVRATLNKHLQDTLEAADLTQQLNHESSAKMSQLVQRIKAAQATYEANREKALTLIRMPKAATNSSKLRSIAKKTLANYDYVEDYERLVINTEKAHRSRETSETEIDDIDVSLSGKITASGTKTTWFYEWDQFQVATAEPVGDKFYIFYTTLKYYTSGANNTPLNKWIIGSRLQGCEIPEKNIDKN